ncbi:MAG: MBL fold metallo-hydrolase [Proteobacteria bacterium]|nr:MBL fold metallo-hydrolase [Pseudomonadota bacterium]
MLCPNSVNICSLASGSKGNSLLVEGPEGALLVDAGLSARELMRRVCLVGMDPARIRGILVTHEHEDHIRGVRVLSRRLDLPVFTTSGTCAAAGLSRECPVNAVTPGVDFHLAGFSISPFSIPHDAADPVGFVLSMGSRKIGIATDLGYATSLVRKRLEGCDFLLIESNHDEKMLLEGPYPWFLKQRIRSRTGHLSNGASSGLLETLSHPGLRWVVLGHLSETNNTPDLALGTALGVLGGEGRGAKVHVAGMPLPTPVFRLDI